MILREITKTVDPLPPPPRDGINLWLMKATWHCRKSGMDADEAARHLQSHDGTLRRQGNGKTARAGLVRALRAHKGCGADDSIWANDVSREYRKLLMAGAVEKTETRTGRDGAEETKLTRKGMGVADAERETERAGELSRGKMQRCRVRYFTAGAVIGSRSFVNEAFANARDRFGKKRRDGAGKMRGDAAAATGMLWSLRDLRKGI